jgi:glucokinase
MIHYAPNVLGFRKTPVQADVAAAVGLPTVVDNDANVAAYAEVKFGAARGRTDAMVITLGTGIGGGVLVGGRVLRGTHGFAAEVGHFQIDPLGPMCACGERGHWEAMASGNALGVMAREAATRGDLPSVLLAVDGDVETIRGPHVSAAARAGAADALALVDAYALNVALGLVGLANIFDPSVIAIAGGLVNDGDLFLAPITTHFLGHIEGHDFRPIPEIVPAQLGERAGVIGAAALALDTLAPVAGLGAS